jgi:YVTN family beta-propeller protein
MRPSLFPAFLIALLAAACTGAEATVPATTVAPIEPLTPVTATTAPPTTAPPPTTTSAAPTTTTTTTLPPTVDLELEKVTTITGDISPKSVVANGAGLFFAQNMMYRHTITVYNDEYELVATIPDAVNLSEFGHGDYEDEHRGAPVEAVGTADGEYMYVSNYQMYGEGYRSAGGDGCNLADWDESFVYRIATDTLEIDQVIGVGAVPKFLAITPDDGLVLASNWCSFDLSVIDTEAGKEITRVPLGRHPRGIAVTGDAKTAYVAIMGSRDIAIVDLESFEVDWLRNVGASPRHLILDPTDHHLYATLNGEGTVAVIDLATGTVTDRINSGAAPRSMTISDDGSSLYVVNYNSDTMSKINTITLEVMQQLRVPHHPIGITFDAINREVWVASYSGAITVFRETEPAIP